MAAACPAALAAAAADGVATSRAPETPTKRRRISSATSSSPRAKARVRAMASRGRLSPGASASNSRRTRCAQSAAHPATIRLSASRSVCGDPTPLILPGTPSQRLARRSHLLQVGVAHPCAGRGCPHLRGERGRTRRSRRSRDHRGGWRTRPWRRTGRCPLFAQPSFRGGAGIVQPGCRCRVVRRAATPASVLSRRQLAVPARDRLSKRLGAHRPSPGTRLQTSCGSDLQNRPFSSPFPKPPSDSNRKPLHYKLLICRAFGVDTGS